MALVINSVARVIKTAYENNKQLAAGAEPNSVQYVKAFNKLNDIIAFLNIRGIKLFQLVDTSVTLTAGNAVYTFGPTGTIVMAKPERVDQAWYEDTSGITNTDRPLFEVSWQEWSILSAKNQRATITQYLQERLPTMLRVTFWNTPDATSASNGNVHLLLRTQIPRGVSITDDTQFPQEWFLALSWFLSDELSGGLAPELVTRAAAKAAYYNSEMENWDVETAEVFLSPDQRSGHERDYY